MRPNPLNRLTFQVGAVKDDSTNNQQMLGTGCSHDSKGTSTCRD